MATTGPDGTWYQCANCGRPWAQHREGGASPGCNCPGYRAGVVVSPGAQAMGRDDAQVCGRQGPGGRLCARLPHRDPNSKLPELHWSGTGLGLYQWTDEDWGPAPVTSPDDAKADPPLAAECRHCGRAITGRALAKGGMQWTDAGNWAICTAGQPHEPPMPRPGEHRCPHCQRMHPYPVPIHPFRGKADRACDDCGQPANAQLHLQSLIPRTTT